MTGFWTIFKRELAGYFATPLAYVFIIIFLALSAALGFDLGGFFSRGQADLAPFFGFHPWLFLLLVPAIGMRLWAEERKTGTIELLMTLPIAPVAAVLGKFAAGWAFTTLAILLTFPQWLTVSFLGQPDHGVILASYCASILLAGAFLAIAAALSAMTRNQVVAFILAAVICFLLMIGGLEVVADGLAMVLPMAVVELASSLSALAHYTRMTQGVLDAAALVFFGSAIALGLLVNVLVVELDRAG